MQISVRIVRPNPHIRGGAGPRGVLPTLSQYMLSSAATFGFFLAIGSVSVQIYHPDNVAKPLSR